MSGPVESLVFTVFLFPQDSSAEPAFEGWITKRARPHRDRRRIQIDLGLPRNRSKGLPRIIREDVRQQIIVCLRASGLGVEQNKTRRPRLDRQPYKLFPYPPCK